MIRSLDHPEKAVFFPDQPDVIDLGFREKQLHSPYIFEWYQNYRRVRLVVPVGFIYNGASVPSIVWSFYPPHALDRAAVFHDMIYRHSGFIHPGAHQYWHTLKARWVDITKVWTREQADDLFARHLEADPKGPGWIRRKLALAAVRAFGGGYWGQRLQPRERKNAR